MRAKGLVIAAALLATAASAQAQNAGTREEQAACRGDVRRLCGHIGKGDNQKYRDCLQSHFSELSQKCQQVLMKHQSSQ